VTSDRIVQEVRRIRKEIEAEHGNSWQALERYYMEKQASSPARLFTGKPKRLPRGRKPTGRNLPSAPRNIL